MRRCAALEFLAEQNPPVTVVPDPGAVKALGLALCGDTTTIKVPPSTRPRRRSGPLSTEKSDVICSHLSMPVDDPVQT